MGDASSKVENDIINKYNLKDIDILKVGHHGSNTSSSLTFINEINPQISLISVGKNNIYYHPNKQTILNLKQSSLYMSSVNGSIHIIINQKRRTIFTYPP